MGKITSITAILLNGEPPAEHDLTPLSSLEATSQLVIESLKPFCQHGGVVPRIVDSWEGENPIADPIDRHASASEGIACIYLVGHGWSDEFGHFEAAVRSAHGSRLIAGSDLVAAIAEMTADAGSILLLVDTCEAERLASDFTLLGERNVAAIFASTIGASAIDVPLDSATRFAMALNQKLSRRRRWPRASHDEVDVIDLAVGLRRALAAPSVLDTQNVTYRLIGPPIWLSAADQAMAARRSRAAQLVRGALIAAGVASAAMAIGSSWYYYSHAVIEIDVSNVAGLGRDATLLLHRVDNKTGTMEETEEIPIRGELIRLYPPAENLVLELRATYPDNYRREVRIPLLLEPTFDLSLKFVRRSVPSAAAIRGRSGMAWIGPGEWRAGEGLGTPTQRDDGFWIDILPVTSAEYEKYAGGEIARGNAIPDDFLFWRRAMQRSSTEMVAPDTLGELMDNLDAVVDIIDQAQRPISQVDPTSFPPLGMPTLREACPRCPAEMTLEEAEHYCAGRGKGIPRQDQWEQAARGVDGRTYPWGNQFGETDRARANCNGLPELVGIPSELTAVDAHASGASPYGLLDVAGNAGEWVIDDDGYDRVYAGGTYRFNREGCKTHDVYPEVGELDQLLPIGVRCVYPRVDPLPSPRDETRIECPTLEEMGFRDGSISLESGTLTVASPPGAWVAGGREARISTPGAVFELLHFDSSRILVRVTEPSWNDEVGERTWELNFEAPIGESLEVANYSGIERIPSDASPAAAMSISFDGSGCNEVSGSFDISTLDIDRSGRLETLRLMFSHVCDDEAEPLTGQLQIGRGDLTSR